MCAASCSLAGHVKIIIFVVFLNFVHKLLPTARNDIRDDDKRKKNIFLTWGLKVICYYYLYCLFNQPVKSSERQEHPKTPI